MFFAYFYDLFAIICSMWRQRWRYFHIVVNKLEMGKWREKVSFTLSYFRIWEFGSKWKLWEKNWHVLVYTVSVQRKWRITGKLWYSFWGTILGPCHILSFKIPFLNSKVFMFCCIFFFLKKLDFSNRKCLFQRKFLTLNVNIKSISFQESRFSNQWGFTFQKHLPHF